MKLVVYAAPGGAASIGLLTDRGVVGVADLLGPAPSPQVAMQHMIDEFETLRPRLAERAARAEALAVETLSLLPPLPRPGKILCSTVGYDRGDAPPPPQLLTLKSAESVVGPGGTVVLPPVGPEWQFLPEAELGLVIRGPAKQLAAADWSTAVFGYTCVFDVMAHGDTQFGRDFWLAKADTLGPLGPCIVTADEIGDPNALRVRSFQNGQPQQDYSTADAEFRVPELLEFATSIMTLYTGDVVACGTSRSGLRPIAAGDELAMQIDGIGRLELQVGALAGSRL